MFSEVGFAVLEDESDEGLFRDVENVKESRIWITRY